MLKALITGFDRFADYLKRYPIEIDHPPYRKVFSNTKELEKEIDRLWDTL